MTKKKVIKSNDYEIDSSVWLSSVTNTDWIKDEIISNYLEDLMLLNTLT